MKFLKSYFNLFTPKFEQNAKNISLLFGRITFGGMMLFGHGIPKLAKFEQNPIKFADPLGIGVSLSLSLAVFAEVVCATLLILGIATRFASLQLLFTMAVAAFLVHEGDPFFGRPGKEFAMVYLSGYMMFFLMGPGKYSIDGLLKKRV